MQNNIPKKIHYIWLGGGKKPKIFYKCFKTWKRILNDYEIIEWNEHNLPMDINKYVVDAVNAKKYAFASDFFRYYILYNHGGIYLDIDVEVLKSFDNLLHFNGFTGYEEEDLIAPGLVFGSIRHNPIVKDLYLEYFEREFIKNNSMNLTTICTYTTSFLNNCTDKDYINANLKIFDKEYFQPMNLKTGKLNITENTMTIHHYSASWVPKVTKFKNFLGKKLIKIIGEEKYYNLLKLIRRGD